MKKEQNNFLPPFEVSLILSHILKKSREYVLAHPEIELTKIQKQKFQKMIRRRLKNEPLAYILGEKGFYGLDFKVSRHTLIPRPETEQIVELATQNVKPGENYTMIDVGTGSGNIIISLAKEIINSKLPITNCRLLATDVSSQALKVARINAKKYKLDKKIKFIKSDLLEYFLNNLTIKQFNHLIIVANLPYLSKKIYNSAPKDVKSYEPKSALYGGIDGLDYYRKLLKQIRSLITSYQLPVTIFMEISPEQKTKIARVIKTFFPKSKLEFKKDLAGKWRVAVFKI